MLARSETTTSQSAGYRYSSYMVLSASAMVTASLVLAVRMMISGMFSRNTLPDGSELMVILSFFDGKDTLAIAKIKIRMTTLSSSHPSTKKHDR